MASNRVLVVEDNEAVRMLLHEGLQCDGFEVIVASNVRDALKFIATESFDVLLTDLHMPLAGDGFTLVSAMRHTHPHALTVILSGYPAVDEAMSAILSQADEIFMKPIQIGALRELIHKRLAEPQTVKRVKPESVASILERETETTIQNWLDAVDQDVELTCISLNRSERTGHLPKLLRDLILRLRLDSGLKAPISMAAREHGKMRLQQGYSAAMVVEESRILPITGTTTLNC
jgi:DNA-binding response OmpR family regulator